ncbi:MAG: class B sortase [Lachnospiraceae bacterium]|nr:class B sortase [Lachnospiraceae bacterium]
MNNSVRKVLTILLIFIFLGSTAMMIYQGKDYVLGRDSYNQAQKLSGLTEPKNMKNSSEAVVDTQNSVEPESEEISTEPVISGESQVDESISGEQEPWKPAFVTDDPYVEMMWEVNLEALREVNEDVIGWIMIPDTVVNYPLLQGEDNDYYLNYTWDKQKNRVGSIFLESTSSPDLSDFHTIIYGHYLKERTMFSPIRNYKNQSFWEKRPYVYIATDEGVFRYEIYASYEAGITTATYRLGFESEQEKQEFIDVGVKQSVIDTGIVPEITDRILTLSTCTGRGHATRWVVQARLKMENVSL